MRSCHRPTDAGPVARPVSAKRVRGGPHDPEIAATRPGQTSERVVDGLLALARVEQATSRSEPLAIAPIVNGRVDAWSAFAEEHDVTFAVEVGDAGLVLATPERLEPVLDNLIANAIEVSPEGTVIRLSATTTAGSMTMTMTMTVAGGRSVGLEAAATGGLAVVIRLGAAPSTPARAGALPASPHMASSTSATPMSIPATCRSCSRRRPTTRTARCRRTRSGTSTGTKTRTRSRPSIRSTDTAA